MAITAKDVSELRSRTGLGMMECKQALSEVGGDMQKAIDLLRQRGLAKMDSRADRASAEGRIAVAVTPDRTRAAIVQVHTETDFTAGNDAFKAMLQSVAAEALKQPAGEVQKTDAMQAAIDNVRLTTKENVRFGKGMVLGGVGSVVGSYVHFTGKSGALVELSGGAVDEELLKGLCQHIVAISPAPIAVRDDQVPADVVAKERQIAKAQAMESGKPENIAEKMVEGKLRKFFEEHVLTKQLYIKDDKKRVSEVLPRGVTIRAFARFHLGA